MKTEFQTNRDEFLRLLTKCAQAANRKSTMPILADVVVTVDGDQVTVMSSDLSMVVSGSMTVVCTKPGSFCVPAKEFIDRVRAMPPDALLTISCSDLELTVKAKGFARRFKLYARSADDFPKVPEVEDTATELVVQKALLSELIEGTHYAISLDESRPHLSAALLEVGSGRARMVATDGHRLAKRELDYEYDGVHKRALIPHRGILVLRKLVSDSDDDEDPITLHVGEFRVFAECGGISFGIQLNDGAFPPYEQVIPNRNGVEPHVVDREALADAIKAVGVSASSRTNGIKVELAEGKVVVSSESPEGGEANDEVPCDGGVEGKSVLFGVSAGYLLDAISGYPEANVAITATGELDPVVIRGNTGDPACLGVIMPMRI